jgi:hypothetical protein
MDAITPRGSDARIMRINSWSWARSSALNRTTYFLTAISFPTTNHLHRCLAATEIQKCVIFNDGSDDLGHG